MAPKKQSQKKSQRHPLYVTIGIFALLLLGVTLISGCAALLTPSQDSGNTAVIPIHGPITSGSGGQQFFDPASVSSSWVTEQIRRADEDDRVKVIVLDINSGGGAPVASAEIAREVSLSSKPTIAWIRDSGASGAYWVASASDTIIAHELSITGSIGVTGSYVEVYGLMDDYNVSYNRLVSGYYKDMGTPLKEMTSSERQIYQDLLDTMHDVFIREVASNRNMSITEVERLADGRVFLGVTAHEHGLVDDLGSKDVVEDHLRELLDEPIDYVRYERSRSLTDMLSSLSTSVSTQIGRGIGEGLSSQSRQSLPRT